MKLSAFLRYLGWKKAAAFVTARGATCFARDALPRFRMFLDTVDSEESPPASDIRDMASRAFAAADGSPSRIDAVCGAITDAFAGSFGPHICLKNGWDSRDHAAALRDLVEMMIEKTRKNSARYARMAKGVITALAPHKDMVRAFHSLALRRTVGAVLAGFLIHAGPADVRRTALDRMIYALPDSVAAIPQNELEAALRHLPEEARIGLARDVGSALARYNGVLDPAARQRLEIVAGYDPRPATGPAPMGPALRHG